MIERSQAEIEADDAMWDIAFEYISDGMLNHLYAMHKLRDEKLFEELRYRFIPNFENCIDDVPQDQCEHCKPWVAYEQMHD